MRGLASRPERSYTGAPEDAGVFRSRFLEAMERLILLFFFVCRRSAERNRRFARVLMIISEIDHIARAVGRPALAAQRFGVHRQQILLGIAQPYVLVIRGGFYMVQRKFRRHAFG